MSDLFSEEMKKGIIKLFDEQYKKKGIAEILDTHRNVYLGIEKSMHTLASDIEDNHDELQDFERRLEEVPDIEPIRLRFIENEKQIEEIKEKFISKDELQTLVGDTMLKLMPNFNEKISREVKKHLVAIAEYVIKTFK